MVSVSQNTHHHKPLMVQAPVRALDPDGVAVVTTGTIGFAVGAVVCWWVAPELAAAGKQWYFGVAVTGTVLGLVGLVVGLVRKTRRRRGRRGISGPDTPTIDVLALPGSRAATEGTPSAPGSPATRPAAPES